MKSSPLLLLGLFGALGFSGCGTPPTGAQYIDPNGQRAIVNENRINYQDFNMAADDLVQSLIKSGAIKDKHADRPTLVAVSRVTNDTDQQFDTDQLTSTITIALLNTGKIQVSNVALGGASLDPLAQEVANKKNFVQNTAAPDNAPDYTLYGKILMDKTSAGDVKQSAYFFDMSLTDVSAGTTVWRDRKAVVKQGKGSSIGF
ncbi:MAG TPA: penicillin-binding protein activator LpoB [Opitutales bacterium]|nr:penicillin-binding protein activator LpoB [Opitutales bacterium]